LVIAADVENGLGSQPSLASAGKLVQPGWKVSLEGELCWIRKKANNELERVAIARARGVEVEGQLFKSESDQNFTEFDGKRRVIQKL
jgi:hypothetical protein